MLRIPARCFRVSPWCALAAVCVAAAGCGSSSSTAPSSTAAALAGVTLSSTTVVGVASITGTIALTAGAPTGGATVTLTSNNAAVIVPASVVVTEGGTTQTFTITTVNAAPATVTITGTYAGVSTPTTLTIGKLTLLNIALSASSVVAGSQAAGTVTLTGPAPPGGAAVSIGSSSGSAAVPAIVTIAEGSTSQTFPIATSGTTGSASTISASYAGATWSATLTIAAKLALQNVSLALGTVPGGLSDVGTITLTAVAPPGGATVSLASSSPLATVPGSVTVAEGTLTQTFMVTTVDTPPTTAVTITATFAGASQSAGLAIIAYPMVSSVTCASTSLTGGGSTQCTGTLSAPAPAGGWQIAINTDNPIASVPAGLTVPPSSSTFQFTVATTPVTAATAVTIQVIDPQSGTVLFSEVLNVTP